MNIDDLTENDRIAFAAMLGASRSHLAVASCPKDKDVNDRRNIHIVKTGIACPDQYSTTKTMFDIFGTLVDKGLEVANFNFAGFSAQQDPEKAQDIAGTQIANFEPGLHVFANIDLTDESGKTPMYPGSKRMFNVVKEISDRATGRRLVYSDSEHPPSRPYILGEGKDLNVSVANDTVRTMLGALCSPNDDYIKTVLKDQNIALVGGLLNGAGFGFSLGQNYNPRLVRFTQVQNDELGWERVPEDLLGPLDRFDDDSNPVRAEPCFAGGKYGALEPDELYGLRREIAVFYSKLNARDEQEQDDFLQELANYYNQVARENNLGYKLSINDIKESELYQAFEEGVQTGEFAIMSNRKLFDLIADSLCDENEDDRDKLVHAMLVSLFERQAKFIAGRYKDQLKSLQVLAVSGSYAIDAIDRMRDVREAFIKPFKAINPDVHLFIHSLHGNDGMDNLAVDMLRMAAGRAPIRDQPRNGNNGDRPKGLFGRLWAIVKSVFATMAALFTRKKPKY